MTRFSSLDPLVSLFIPASYSIWSTIRKEESFYERISFTGLIEFDGYTTRWFVFFDGNCEDFCLVLQVAMCNFKSVRDAAAVAIATMHSGIQVLSPIILGICFMVVTSIFVLN